MASERVSEVNRFVGWDHCLELHTTQTLQMFLLEIRYSTIASTCHNVCVRPCFEPLTLQAAGTVFDCNMAWLVRCTWKPSRVKDRSDVKRKKVLSRWPKILCDMLLLHCPHSLHAEELMLNKARQALCLGSPI